jgi:hypothetical protein
MRSAILYLVDDVYTLPYHRSGDLLRTQNLKKLHKKSHKKYERESLERRKTSNKRRISFDKNTKWRQDTTSNENTVECLRRLTKSSANATEIDWRSLYFIFSFFTYIIIITNIPLLFRGIIWQSEREYEKERDQNKSLIDFSFSLWTFEITPKR